MRVIKFISNSVLHFFFKESFYHQIKKSIGFWCKLSEILLVELAETYIILHFICIYNSIIGRVI